MNQTAEYKITPKYKITLKQLFKLFIITTIISSYYYLMPIAVKCEEHYLNQKVNSSNEDISEPSKASPSKVFLPKQNNETNQPVEKHENAAPFTPAPPAQNQTIKTQQNQTIKTKQAETAPKQESRPSKQTNTLMLVLAKAVMCEAIKGFEPDTYAVVFSISLGKIFCFTSFDNISQNTFVYHKWFHRDRFVATNRFLIKAPQWSTFSTMQLRVADKGPWRVEVTDEKDNILKTLRFSVSD